MKPLVDGHGRSIGDVRISVTDRCNFRCQYCMPAEGLPWLDRESLLSYEEIARLVQLLGAMGVHDVRLTDLGGEWLQLRQVAPAQLHLVAALGELDRAITPDPPRPNDSDPHAFAPFPWSNATS